MPDNDRVEGKCPTCGAKATVPKIEKDLSERYPFEHPIKDNNWKVVKCQN